MELLHQMAYNSKRECVSIDEVLDNEKYYYDNKLINEFILRRGKINRHHFALKNSISGIGGETDLHRDAKMWLVKTKEFRYCDYLIKAHSVKYEQATVHESNRIPDVTFYDEQGGVICIIEVVNTNFISYDKEIELKERNILTFEAIIKHGSYKEFESIRYFGSREIEEQREESKERIDGLRRTSEERIERERGRINDRIDGLRRTGEERVYRVRGENEERLSGLAKLREESNKRVRRYLENRDREGKERLSKLRFELQRKEDLLNREVDKETNIRFERFNGNLKEQVKRKQHELSISADRVKRVGDKLSKIKQKPTL